MKGERERGMVAVGIGKGISRDWEITSRRRGCKRRGVVEEEGDREGWVDRKGGV